MKFSRRSLVQNAGLVAGAGLLGLGTGATGQSPARGNGKPRALALIGDRYHNADYIRVSLDKVFQDLSIPIDYTIDIAGFSAASLKPYQLLLIFRDGDNSVNGYSGILTNNGGVKVMLTYPINGSLSGTVTDNGTTTATINPGPAGPTINYTNGTVQSLF